MNEKKENRVSDHIKKIGLVALELKDRPYESVDFEMAQDWWRRNGRGELPEYVLSPLGCVIENNGAPIAMGWIYLTNSYFAQLGWFVTDPNASMKLKAASLLRLFIVGEELAKRHGYRAIQMLSDQPTLNKLALVCGWTKMTPHTFLIRSLEPAEGTVLDVQQVGGSHG